MLDSLIDYWRAKGQALPFGQLQLEVHTSSRSFQYVLSWWEKLEAAGLRPFFIEVC